MKKVSLYGALCALVMIGVFMILKNVYPMIGITSGSMEPTLPIKSSVIIVDEPSYEVGQIITFWTSGERVTHRLVKINGDGTYVTKGDANPTPDAWLEPITKDDVQGRVIYMTPLGTTGFWTSRRGIGAILCVMVMIAATKWRKEEETDEARDSQEDRVITPA